MPSQLFTTYVGTSSSRTRRLEASAPKGLVQFSRFGALAYVWTFRDSKIIRFGA
jgi:hypothetical protein